MILDNSNTKDNNTHAAVRRLARHSRKPPFGATRAAHSDSDNTDTHMY